MQTALIAITVIGFWLPVLGWAQLGRGNQSSNTFHREHIIYLQGKVVLEDGSPPPEFVTIQRVCGGQVFREGYTDSKGEFSVRLGADGTLAMEDASTYGTNSRGTQSGDPLRSGGLTGASERFSTMRGAGTVDLFGCELQAKLDGYRAAPIMLGRRSVFDKPDVGTIILHPLKGIKGVAVSATSLAAPKNARKAYEAAANELRKKKPNLRKAVQQLEKALGAHPNYAAAWNLLGRTRLFAGDEPKAREAYTRALEADPKYLGPYVPLIQLSVRQADWRRAADYSDRLLKLNPHAADVRFYYALARFQLGDIGEAHKALQQVTPEQAKAKALPQVYHLRGLILAKQGEFPKAAEEFRTFLREGPNELAAPQVTRQLAEWEALGVIEKSP